MDTANIYGLWPDLVYCVWAVGRLFTALVARRLIYWILHIDNMNSLYFDKNLVWLKNFNK